MGVASMVPADVVLSFICFSVSSVTELPIAVTAIRAVNRNWNVYVFKIAATLFFKLPYNLQLVCSRINFSPSDDKVNLKIAQAQRVKAFTCDAELAEFIEVVNASLILQHLKES